MMTVTVLSLGYSELKGICRARCIKVLGVSRLSPFGEETLDFQNNLITIFFREV